MQATDAEPHQLRHALQRLRKLLTALGCGLSLPGVDRLEQGRQDKDAMSRLGAGRGGCVGASISTKASG